MYILKYPLTNAQIELMKLFSLDLSDSDLNDLKKHLSAFFAEKAIAAANKIWDNNGLNNENMDRLISKHFKS